MGDVNGFIIFAHFRRQLYETVASSGLSHRLAVMLDDPRQAAVHKRLQAEAGVSVPLLRTLKDITALRSTDGLPHANVSLLTQEVGS